MTTVIPGDVGQRLRLAGELHSGHQTALLATDYCSELAPVAAAMFARWAQENFFKYAREHFGLDRLIDYRTQPISEPIRVVNPAYRQLDAQVRCATGKLNRVLAQFGALNIEHTIEPEKIEPFLHKKAALQEHIEQLQELWLILVYEATAEMLIRVHLC